MKLTIVAIGKKMPAWVESAYTDYKKRLPKEINVNLIALSLATRGKNVSIEKLKQDEYRQIQSATPDNNQVIALDLKGRSISTDRLAQRIDDWQMQGQNVTILIGGPDGLASECVQSANEVWSLSAMTLPHPLVRVVLIEQIYRAWSILANHPYHK